MYFVAKGFAGKVDKLEVLEMFSDQEEREGQVKAGLEAGGAAYDR